jgi:hypothetical protein
MLIVHDRETDSHAHKSFQRAHVARQSVRCPCLARLPAALMRIGCTFLEPDPEVAARRGLHHWTRLGVTKRSFFCSSLCAERCARQSGERAGSVTSLRSDKVGRGWGRVTAWRTSRSHRPLVSLAARCLLRRSCSGFHPRLPEGQW